MQQSDRAGAEHGDIGARQRPHQRLAVDDAGQRLRHRRILIRKTVRQRKDVTALDKDTRHTNELGEAAIEPVAVGDQVAADIASTRQALPARATGKCRTHRHPRAALQSGMTTGLDNLGRELVAENGWKTHALGFAPAEDADIGAADGGSPHPEQHISRLEAGGWNLLQRHDARSQEDGSLHRGATAI